MDRRHAVKQAAILMGGVLSASTLAVMLDGCNSELRQGKGTEFTDDEKNMVAAMADIIIPRTNTPGAKDAGVPDFIVMMMQECYPDKDQDQFHAGLAAFDKLCREKYGDPFLKLSPDKQATAVKDLDTKVLGKKDKSAGDKDKAGKDDLAFYRKLKELTLLGYFTSKPGATETLRYVQIPGRFDGCVPSHKGDKAWAT